MSAQANAARGPRDRPPGLAPRGTAWGLAAIMVLCMVSPAAAVFSAVPWAALSLDALLGSAFGSVLFSFIVVTPLAAGLQTRRFWVVCWYFGTGVLSLVVYVAAVLVALAGASGVFATLHPDLVGAAWLGRLFLLACAPMLFALWRGLRLAYWRPWSPPQAWEAGDERNAVLATKLVTGSPQRKR